VHSDTPGAAAIGRAVRAAVEEAGHAVSSELTAQAGAASLAGRVGAAES